MQIMGEMLRKYRGLLPYSTWHSICMHCMHVVEETLSGLETKSANKQSDSTSTLVTQNDANAQVKQCNALGGVRALMQYVLCVLHAVIHELQVRVPLPLLSPSERALCSEPSRILFASTQCCQHHIFCYMHVADAWCIHVISSTQSISLRCPGSGG